MAAGSVPFRLAWLRSMPATTAPADAAQATLPRCRPPPPRSPTLPRALGWPPAQHPPRSPGAGRILFSFGPTFFSSGPTISSSVEFRLFCSVQFR
jgi:hypothetical protein